MRAAAWRRAGALGALLLAAAVSGAGSDEELPYGLLYDVRIVPTERAARVKLRLDNREGLVLSVRLAIDPDRYRDFAGDGEVEVGEDAVVWNPSPGTATLSYVAHIDHLRDARSYDARCAGDWAIFRGEDLVPPARVRTLKGARSQAKLRLRVPQRWSVVAPYARGADDTFDIDDPERGFDQPHGWFATGRLGVVRERVSGVHVAVAGPVGQNLRRLDILALLRWSLPELASFLPVLPERLVVVGAGDPMWRGGLSGPRSAFIHSGRPLISQDGTSPLLHELMHAVLGIRPGPGGDWIVEGLAEFYSMQLLVRSGTISHRRFERSLARLEARGRSVKKVETDHSEGAVTARAVSVLVALDERLRKGSDGQHSLDDVVRVLSEKRGEVTTPELRALAEDLGGGDLSAFFSRRLGSSAASPTAAR